MSFSVALWNVEHFKRRADDPPDFARAARVAQFLAGVAPDVFALFEVEGREVFPPFIDELGAYSFFITESDPLLSNPQEILVGVRSDMQVFVTQRLEFRSNVPTMRPGSLVTVIDDGDLYPLLFLHLKSASNPIGFGLRDDQVERALRFLRTLNGHAAGQGLGPVNYVFCGDLNSMGMNLTYSQNDSTGAHEISRLRQRAAARGMRLLDKTSDMTWWGAGQLPPSNLDHVVASTNSQFVDQGGAEVAVRGWPEIPDEVGRRQWIADFSDHALLTFEFA